LLVASRRRTFSRASVTAAWLAVELFKFMRGFLFSLMFAWAAASSLGVELVGVPVIAATPTNAVVQWVTDVTAGTRVHVSPEVKILAEKTPGTQHTATLSGLRPGVTYTVVVGTARVPLATNVFTTTGTATSAAPNVFVSKTNLPAQKIPTVKTTPPTRKIWGNFASLPDHFARHGGDFHAVDAEDYARQSWEFLQRAKADGLPAKLDQDGVLRVFDPQSGTFAAYNHDGTTKTFFKPGGRDYFDRQPGRVVNLKTLK